MDRQPLLSTHRNDKAIIDEKDKNCTVITGLLFFVCAYVFFIVRAWYSLETNKERNCDNLGDPEALMWATFLFVIPICGVCKLAQQNYGDIHTAKILFIFLLECIITAIIIWGEFKYRHRPPNTSNDTMGACWRFWVCIFNFVFFGILLICCTPCCARFF